MSITQHQIEPTAVSDEDVERACSKFRRRYYEASGSSSALPLVEPWFVEAMRAALESFAKRAPVGGEAVAYWAAVDGDSNIIVNSLSADDGNSGEAARREVNDYINDILLSDGITLHLVPLYAHPAADHPELLTELRNVLAHVGNRNDGDLEQLIDRAAHWMRGSKDCIDMQRPLIEAHEAVADEKTWQHAANEWADAATNGLQYLINVRDGICSFEEALAGLSRDIAHARSEQPPLPTSPGPQAVPEGMCLVPRQVLESIRDSSSDPFARGFACALLAAKGCADHG